MKKAVSFLLSALMLCISSFSCSAQDYTFELTQDYSSGHDTIEYMPEQQIYHFRQADSITEELPACGGIYAYVTLGGYHSEANGITDNGINSVFQVSLSYLDENREAVYPPKMAVILVPADGVFRRYSLGTEDMYAGLPENVKTVCFTVFAQNDTAYIRNMYITSSDTSARDMSEHEWEIHEMGNINAHTTRADYWIMVGFVFAVALIMMIFAKVRNKYRKGK